MNTEPSQPETTVIKAVKTKHNHNRTRQQAAAGADLTDLPNVNHGDAKSVKLAFKAWKARRSASGTLTAGFSPTKRINNSIAVNGDATPGKESLE